MSNYTPAAPGARSQIGLALGWRSTKRKQMRRIKQRYGDDCGIACVAMVAGVPYAQAAEKFSLKPNGSRLTNTKDLITALRLLGVSVEGDHLEPLPKQSYRWRAALREDECVAILKSPQIAFLREQGMRANLACLRSGAGSRCRPKGSPIPTLACDLALTHQISLAGRL